jgi:hypothetical protein
MDILEKEVEKYLVQYAHKNNILTYKLVSPGNSGVPDRIFVNRDGTVRFVEVKAPGKKPRPLQQSVFAKLASHGQPVLIIDTKGDAQLFIDQFRGDDDAV